MLRDLLDLADEVPASWATPMSNQQLLSHLPQPSPPAEWELITVALPPTSEQLALFPEPRPRLQQTEQTASGLPSLRNQLGLRLPVADATGVMPTTPSTMIAPRPPPPSPTQLSPAPTRRQESHNLHEMQRSQTTFGQLRQPSLSNCVSTEMRSPIAEVQADKETVVGTDEEPAREERRPAVYGAVDGLGQLIADCREATARIAAQWDLSAADRARLVAGAAPSLASVQAKLGEDVRVYEVGEGLAVRSAEGGGGDLAIVAWDALGRAGLTAEEVLDHVSMRAGRRAARRVRHWERLGDSCLKGPLLMDALPRRWNLVAQVHAPR